MDYPLLNNAIMEDEWYSGQDSSVDLGEARGGAGGAMGVGGGASATGGYRASFTPPDSHRTPGMMPGQVPRVEQLPLCTAVSTKDYGQKAQCVMLVWFWDW